MMTSVADQSFSRGAAIVWRSRPDRGIGFVFACRVLADEPDRIAVVQPTGAPVARRVGRRGGPGGRAMVPGGWDGTSRAVTAWDGPPSCRVHPVGRAYSVIRWWDANTGRHQGWYVNLEQPWVRTSLGFDSRDHILDVVVADDLSSCALKDEDELAYAVEVGKLTRAEAEAIHATAADAIEDVAQRRWPFDESAWSAFEPLDYAEPPGLPDGWDQP